MPEPVDVFVAFPGHLREEARTLRVHLADAGVSAFVDHSSLAAGDAWGAAIRAAQAGARATVVLLHHDRSDSPWLADEIALAVDLTRRGDHVVVPVWLDGIPQSAADWPYGLGGFQPIDQAAAGWAGVVAPLLARLGRAPHPAAPAQLQPPGGSYEEEWYVPRGEIETLASASLQHPGMPVVLFGPWLSGKSWTRERILERLPDGADVARIDPEWLSCNATPERDFWRLLVDELADTFKISRSDADYAWSRPGTGAQRLTWFVETCLLAGRTGRGPLVLSFDPADRLLEEGTREVFFTMLRNWSVRGKAWTHLRLVLCVSSTPSRLSQNQDKSPFNLTPPVRMTALDDPGIAALLKMHQLPPDAASTKLLRSAFDGHPYLTRIALYRSRLLGVQLSDLLAPDADEYDAFLSGLRKRLARRPGMRDALRTITRNPGANLDGDVIDDLIDAGVVRQEAGTGGLRVRIPLFTRLGA